MMISLVEIASILFNISQSNPRGAAYACSGNSFRGGVSPRFTRRLKGQSIIEYVLIIAVIGLVIVFAGPGLAGAIRNQFNLVGNTVNSGTSGGTEGGGASGSGSTGADSATVQAAIAKDAKDWTLDEQKAVAEDIAAKGEASPAYAKAKAAMDAGTKFSMKLTNGKTLEYRIIGINHDDLADGSGKAGLTFLTTSTGIMSRMNATDTNVGGWEKCELRQKMNSGEIWNLMPSDLQSKVKSVRKLTNNVGGTDLDVDVTATIDKLFLLSYSETAPNSPWIPGYSWTDSEGIQYEAFKGKVTHSNTSNSAIAIGISWWQRSVSMFHTSSFFVVSKYGAPGGRLYRNVYVLELRLSRLVLLVSYSSNARPARFRAGLSISDYGQGAGLACQLNLLPHIRISDGN